MSEKEFIMLSAEEALIVRLLLSGPDASEIARSPLACEARLKDLRVRLDHAFSQSKAQLVFSRDDPAGFHLRLSDAGGAA